jgi:two-component system alkaline phosphatase synthesis response regulator PhoP
MRKIFILEDDDDIRELVCYALEANEFETQGFAEPSGFKAEIAETLPDLVLMDVMLPEQDGISILKELREADRTKRLPVIMLTAKTSEYDRIIGLDVGADDYVAKPFSVMELISRIKAVLRRTEDVVPAPVESTVGPVTINLDKRTVTIDAAEVFFTNKEFQLLHYLMQRQGIVVTREELMEQVWGFGFEGESRTVDVHIKTVRQKLGVHGDLIRTVRSVGYIMEAEI